MQNSVTTFRTRKNCSPIDTFAITNVLQLINSTAVAADGDQEFFSNYSFRRRTQRRLDDRPPLLTLQPEFVSFLRLNLNESETEESRAESSSQRNEIFVRERREGKRGVILINFNREKLNARRNLRLKISNWIDGYKSIGFKISFLYNTHDSFEFIRQFSTRSKYSRDRYFQGHF